MAAPAQACGLAFLPSELLKLIFDHLKQKSLLQVRLSCRALSSHATPGAFKRITVWLEEGRLSDIAKIAEQPHLAHHVRHISCGMEEFYDLSFDDFKTKLSPYGMIEGSARAKAKHLEASWQIYHSYAAKQLNMDSTGQGHTMLCECFNAFPNLNSIEIHGDDSGWPNPPNGLRLLRLEPRLRRQMLLVYQPSLGQSRGMRQLSTMVKALAHADRLMKNFCLRPFDCEMNGGGLLAPLNPYEEGLALAAFAGLRSLDLDLWNLDNGQFTASTPETSSLSTILRAAVNLKSLRVRVRDLKLLQNWTGLSWSTSGPGGPRCLETLVIEGAALDQTKFIELMQASGQELRSLTIHKAEIPYGSSTAIFNAIRSLPKLERVESSQLFWDSLGQPPTIISGTSIGGRINDVDAQPLYDHLMRQSNIFS